MTLRSKDPHDPPCINFHYFEEGDDTNGEDLDSIVPGVRFVPKMTASLKEEQIIAEEVLPGEHFESDEALKHFICSNAWGHHASCTCAIGPKEDKWGF